jgi:hypothetical protein
MQQIFLAPSLFFALNYLENQKDMQKSLLNKNSYIKFLPNFFKLNIYPVMFDVRPETYEVLHKMCPVLWNEFNYNIPNYVQINQVFRFICAPK